MRTESSVSLATLARVFLSLGAFAFGGPAAHIAMMEAEVVRKRRWLSSEAFLDLLGATHLIPGPNSTELAIHVGYAQRGWPGLCVAGLCFILPAFCIVLALAWGYVAYGALPEVAFILYGIKPVILAIVLQAIWNLAKSALKTPLLIVLALSVLILNGLGLSELLLLFGTGILTGVLYWLRQHRSPPSMPGLVASPWLLVASLGSGGVSGGTVSVGLWPLFFFFLKVGSVLFGSGYVLLAFLQADLVDRWGWLTSSQLLDAVVVGQVTPGPVFTTATFIGYLLAGVPGAAVATIAIFLPAFVFVAVSAPFLSQLRQAKVMGHFLDGVNAAAVSLMLGVSMTLAQTAVTDHVTWGLLIISSVLLIRYRMSSLWLILAGAFVGPGIHWIASFH